MSDFNIIIKYLKKVNKQRKNAAKKAKSASRKRR